MLHYALCVGLAETCTKTGMVMVFGEITTKSKVNYGSSHNQQHHPSTWSAWTGQISAAL